MDIPRVFYLKTSEQHHPPIFTAAQLSALTRCLRLLSRAQQLRQKLYGPQSLKYLHLGSLQKKFIEGPMYIRDSTLFQA